MEHQVGRPSVFLGRGSIAVSRIVAARSKTAKTKGAASSRRPVNVMSIHDGGGGQCGLVLLPSPRQDMVTLPSHLRIPRTFHCPTVDFAGKLHEVLWENNGDAPPKGNSVKARAIQAEAMARAQAFLVSRVNGRDVAMRCNATELQPALGVVDSQAFVEDLVLAETEGLLSVEGAVLSDRPPAVWSAVDHALFPPVFRRKIVTVMLAWQRHARQRETNAPLGRIPLSLLVHLILPMVSPSERLLSHPPRGRGAQILSFDIWLNLDKAICATSPPSEEERSSSSNGSGTGALGSNGRVLLGQSSADAEYRHEYRFCNTAAAEVSGRTVCDDGAREEFGITTRDATIALLEPRLALARVLASFLRLAPGGDSRDHAQLLRHPGIGETRGLDLFDIGCLLDSLRPPVEAEVVEHWQLSGLAASTRLFKYQRQAVRWCLAMEKGEVAGDGDRTHAMWMSVKLPPARPRDPEERKDDDEEEGVGAEMEVAETSPEPAPLIFQPLHERDRWFMTLSRPRAPELPHGGILADEMGLGKSLEIISLILAHPRARTGQTREDSSGAMQPGHVDPTVVDGPPTGGGVGAASGAAVCGSHTIELGQATRLRKAAGIGVSQAPQLGWKRRTRLNAAPDDEADNTSFYEGDRVAIAASIVICPATIVKQWLDEFRRHAPSLRVMEYRGMGERTVWAGTLADFDAVLCSYEVVRRDLRRSGPTISSPLLHVDFWRIVLDEAQMVGSASSQTAKTCSQISGRKRWCVSGTPVGRGRVRDLHGLLSFIYGNDPSVASLVRNQSWFQRHVSIPFELGCPVALQCMQSLLSGLVWRNRKSLVGEQIVLPPCRRRSVRLEMTELESVLYGRRFEEARRELIAHQRAYRIRHSSKGSAGAVDDAGATTDAAAFDAVASLSPQLPWLAMQKALQMRQFVVHPEAARMRQRAAAAGAVSIESLILELELEATRTLVAATNAFAKAALGVAYCDCAPAAEQWQALHSGLRVLGLLHLFEGAEGTRGGDPAAAPGGEKGACCGSEQGCESCVRHCRTSCKAKAPPCDCPGFHWLQRECEEHYSMLEGDGHLAACASQSFHHSHRSLEKLRVVCLTRLGELSSRGMSSAVPASFWTEASMARCRARISSSLPEILPASIDVASRPSTRNHRVGETAVAAASSVDLAEQQQNQHQATDAFIAGLCRRFSSRQRPRETARGGSVRAAEQLEIARVDLKRIQSQFNNASLRASGEEAGSGAGDGRGSSDAPPTICTGCTCAICHGLVQEAAVAPCRHVFCVECAHGRLQASSDGGHDCLCPVCSAKFDAHTLLHASTALVFDDDNEKEEAGPASAEPPSPSASPLSTKMRFVIEKLREIEKADASAKSIIFSQWNSCLQLVGRTLLQHGINFAVLRGARGSNALERFRDDADCNVLLIPMRTGSGGAGLTLTMARFCFLMDPATSPEIEEQAIARLHRLGQTAEVEVFQPIVQGTIEEHVEKFALRRGAAEDGDGQSSYTAVHEGSLGSAMLPWFNIIAAMNK